MTHISASDRAARRGSVAARPGADLLPRRRRSVRRRSARTTQADHRRPPPPGRDSDPGSMPHRRAFIRGHHDERRICTTRSSRTSSPSTPTRSASQWRHSGYAALPPAHRSARQVAPAARRADQRHGIGAGPLLGRRGAAAGAHRAAGRAAAGLLRPDAGLRRRSRRSWAPSWSRSSTATTPRGLPSHLATILLLDPDTGALLAVMDGRYITEARTAAVSAVSARHLARADARRARDHRHRRAGPQSSRGAGRGAAAGRRAGLEPAGSAAAIASSRTCRARSPRRLARQRLGRGRRCAAPTSSCSSPPRPTPVIDDAWVAPGTHVISVGACRPDQREMAPALVARARLVVDSRAAALVESGDVVQGISEGRFDATPCRRRARRGACSAGSPGAATATRSRSSSRSAWRWKTSPPPIWCTVAPRTPAPAPRWSSEPGSATGEPSASGSGGH